MKYATLRTYLSAQTEQRISMSFAEIAAAAKVKLPASAFRYPQWWENDSEHHVQAKAWLDAGYKTERLDLEAQRVEFVRTGARGRGVREMRQVFDDDPDPKKVKMHPMIGALKGTFTIRDWDVTKPGLDEDELAEWEANIERKFDVIAARRVKPK